VKSALRLISTPRLRGAGPSAVAALHTGKIDALVMWDAMLGAAENTGLALRAVNIPLEDRMVGTTLATKKSFTNTFGNPIYSPARPMNACQKATATKAPDSDP
jgi:hypothetical protein